MHRITPSPLSLSQFVHQVGLAPDIGQARIPALIRVSQLSPTAHLPDSWSEAWVQALVTAGVRQITTIENEYPFLSYVEEAGGPAGLGARNEVAIYSAGFPTPSLVTALVELSRRVAGASFRHWGDADVGGIRIWWLLRSRLNRPIPMFRTTAEWIAREVPNGGRSLSGLEMEALRRLQAQIETTDGDDIRSALELINTLLAVGIKLEQERF